MKPSDKTIKLATDVVTLCARHTAYISKLKMEVFKDSYQFYLVLPQSILTLVIKESIVAEFNNKMHQYTLDFYNNEKNFDDFQEFQRYFEDIIKPIREWAEGIVASYEGDEYLCEVEVSHIDTDRQMGTEIIYTVKFYNPESEEDIIAAEVSEYPYGLFSIFDKNQEVETDDEKILAYFYKHHRDDSTEDDDDRQQLDPPDFDMDF